MERRLTTTDVIRQSRVATVIISRVCYLNPTNYYLSITKLDIVPLSYFLLKVFPDEFGEVRTQLRTLRVDHYWSRDGVAPPLKFQHCHTRHFILTSDSSLL